MEKELVLKILEENDDEDYRIREDYSGRGMFGKQTYAIIVPTFDDAGFLCKKYKLRKDNMGLNYVVY